jgi:hypothetical protein
VSGQFLARNLSLRGGYRPQYPIDRRLGRTCRKPINVLYLPGIEAGGNQAFKFIARR